MNSLEQNLSYDPFSYIYSIELLGIMGDKVNLNGRWYSLGEEFGGAFIHNIEDYCVSVGEDKLCLVEKKFLEN